MSERYHGYVPTVSGRSPVSNPARSSMPTNVGYSSKYAGDVQVASTASRRHHITPRGYSTSSNTAGIPTTIRTYAVIQEPRAASKARESRTRRSTLDSSSRPPVIVTTTELERPHASSSTRASNGLSRSPVRDDYRASDGQVYSQPASSIRARSSARPYNAASSGADLRRYRERADNHFGSHDLGSYRSSRPYVVYPSDPRHSTAAIDYGDEGYQYTNVGELVKYDLDHSKPGRPSRRHDSFDAGYYRPNVNYDADRRNFNVNTSHDINRPPRSLSRPPEGKGGSPQSTRGFDKSNRVYESRHVPPAVPIPPSPTTTATHLELLETYGSRRPRPLSLHQEGRVRSIHHDDSYRSREGERTMRDLRDRERDRNVERRSESARYQDQVVATRGFGTRTDPISAPVGRDHRHDTRLDEPRRRSDEELSYGIGRDKDNRHRSRQADADEPRSTREGGSAGGEDSQDRSEWNRVHNSLATGLGAVATAAGLAPAIIKSPERRAQEYSAANRRYNTSEECDSRKDETRVHDRVRDRVREPTSLFERARETTSEREPIKAKDLILESKPLMIHEKDPAPTKDPLRTIIREKEPRDREPVRERDYVRARESVREREHGRQRELTREPEKDFVEPVRRPTSETRPNGEAGGLSGSDSEDTKRPRRTRTSATFNPNDTSDLTQLREQLATKETTDKRRARDVRRPAAAEKTRTRSRSASKDRAFHGSPGEASLEELQGESRCRELIVPASEGRQVRVVSPPREKSEEKPLKGILKQPKASFPEEENPVREGVAPHKEDKKLKEVPSGARWTKINRKIVNPEALTIGKERFEVRDDFVIVLRVLSKEEIQAYAAATQVLRERRRNKHDGDKDRDDGDVREHEQERERKLDCDRSQESDDNEETERRRRRRRHRRDYGEEDDDSEGRPKQKDRKHDRERNREQNRSYNLGHDEGDDRESPHQHSPRPGP